MTELSPAVGSVPMNIVIQAQTDCEAVAGQTCPAPWAATEPNVDVAWVVAYEATHQRLRGTRPSDTRRR